MGLDMETKNYSLKTMMEKPERLAPGHRMCAGCGATIGVRAVLRGLHEGDHAAAGSGKMPGAVSRRGRRQSK